MNFMTCSSGGLYRWPDVQDVALQMKDDILWKAKPPYLQNEQSQFKFNEHNLDAIKKQFSTKMCIYFK